MQILEKSTKIHTPSLILLNKGWNDKFALIYFYYKYTNFEVFIVHRYENIGGVKNDSRMYGVRVNLPARIFRTRMKNYIIIILRFAIINLFGFNFASHLNIFFI